MPVRVRVMPVRTVVERGPKGKKAVAFAVDWPGWSRGAKTPELALETLESYRERYRPVAVAARMAKEFDRRRPLEGGRGPGWPGLDRLLGHLVLALELRAGADGRKRSWTGRSSCLRACWSFFDGVGGAGVGGDAQGPRGGGRDRDRDHPPHHPHRERGLREANRAADAGGAARSARTACGSSARPTSPRCARTTPARGSGCALEPAVPHSTQRLPHDGPRLGDGGQGPLGRHCDVSPPSPPAQRGASNASTMPLSLISDTN